MCKQNGRQSFSSTLEYVAYKFPLVLMGPSLPGLRTLDPPLNPPLTLFHLVFITSVWERGVNKFDQAILSTFLLLFSGGPPRFFLTPNLIFLELKTPCKISEPYHNPFLEKSNPRRNIKCKLCKC